MAKDRTPRKARPTGAGKGGNGSRAGGGRGGRTRPVNAVVAQQRPWGLIAASLAVVVFAAAVITYAVVQVNRANAEKVQSAAQIDGIQSFDYGKGQGHVPTPVDYAESPPVGGDHDVVWADCTGSVYEVDIRNENAVHAMEHGGLWITYDPERVSSDDVAILAALVDGTSGRMLSPRPGLDSPVSLQAWNNQLKVDSVADPRIAQFADLFTFNADSTPELGATCERPDFLAAPVTADPSASAPAAATTAGTGTP